MRVRHMPVGSVWIGALAGALGLAGCGFNADAPPLPVVSLDVAPPPITGGTLAVSERIAVIGDADRDRVHVVALGSGARVARIELSPGAEPGRVAFDPAGLAHVVLRGAGAILSVDEMGGRASTDVCLDPSGIDADPDGVRWVACRDGSVWRLDDGGARAIARLEPGLRDVIALDGLLLVTHLRSARVYVLSREGAPIRTLVPPSANVAGLTYVPNTAARLRRRGDRAWLLYQRSRVGAEPAPTDRYAGNLRGPCGESSVQTVVSEVTPTRIADGAVLASGSLAVDVDADASGSLALALAGEIGGWDAQRRRRVRRVGATGPCLQDAEPIAFDGQAVAVAITSRGELVAFSREPAAVLVGGRMLDLGEPSRRDTGHDLFHVRREGVSCASCHTEGAEDGHLWTLGTSPARRTSTLRGGVAATAPFHADADIASLHEVMRRQFPEEAELYLDAASVGAMARWLDALPARTRSVGDTRGAQVFEALGCVGCHAGALGTTPGLVEVGARRAAVPTLVELADRAPFLADGCAPTLEDVFDPRCGLGPEHTRVATLNDADRGALLQYLRSR